MFFVVLVGISLLGEVNWVVTWLITRGVVVLRLLHSGLRSEAGSVCLAPPTTRVIQNLTEDREPTSPLDVLITLEDEPTVHPMMRTGEDVLF